MVFDGTVTHSDDGMCGLCGEDAREEVEVSMFVFQHMVVEFEFYCVGAVFIESVTCTMWGECG